MDMSCLVRGKVPTSRTAYSSLTKDCPFGPDDRSLSDPFSAGQLIDHELSYLIDVHKHSSKSCFIDPKIAGNRVLDHGWPDHGNVEIGFESHSHFPYLACPCRFRNHLEGGGHQSAGQMKLLAWERHAGARHENESFRPLLFQGTEKMLHLRRRLPAMSERIWAPTLERGFPDFETRLTATDRLLQKIIRPAVFELEGQIDPGYEGSRFNRENGFSEKLTVKLKPLRDNDVIRFTTDGSTPTSESARYETPLELTDSTSLVVQVLDAEGRPRGFPWRTDFELHPIQVAIDGLIDKISTDPAHLPGEFGERVTVTMSSSLEEGRNPLHTRWTSALAFVTGLRVAVDSGGHGDDQGPVLR